MTATRKKANNKRLLILVLLLIVVIALMWFLPSPDATQPNNDPTATTEQTAEEETDENTTLVKVGDKAPDFRVEMFDGTTFTLASLEGKVVPTLPRRTLSRSEGCNRPLCPSGRRLRLPAYFSW